MIEIPPRLEAPRVALRPVREDDIGVYVRAFVEDPDLGRLLGVEQDPSEDELRARIEGAQRRAADGKGLELAIEVAGEFVGSVVLHSFDRTHRRCEIGFWLAPAARRRGLTAAAVVRLLDWIFDELPIDRVEMTTTVDNEATQALARRLGFAREGVWRKRNVERGRRVDVVLFGLLAGDPRPRVGGRSRP